MLDHQPIREPRQCTPGEGIYLGLWQEYLQTAPSRLQAILRDVTVEPTQRDATVAASFMVFMGCHGGMALASLARTLVQRGIASHKAFVYAWADINERHFAVDNGLRVIEAMLSHEFLVREGRVKWDAVPDISMQDIDVVECMVKWWSGWEAEQMRAIAEPLIDAANRKKLSEIFKPQGAEGGYVHS